MHKIEFIEQFAAVIITTALVMINYLLFTPWRNGQDPREENTTKFNSKETIVFNMVQKISH